MRCLRCPDATPHHGRGPQTSDAEKLIQSAAEQWSSGGDIVWPAVALGVGWGVTKKCRYISLQLICGASNSPTVFFSMRWWDQNAENPWWSIGCPWFPLGWNSQKVRERAGGEFRACDPCLGRAGANMEAGSDLGTMGYPKALWCHQTWLAGQSLIKFDDFSIPMIQMLILFSSRVFHLSDSVRISNNDLTATTLDMIGLWGQLCSNGLVSGLWIRAF